MRRGGESEGRACGKRWRQVGLAAPPIIPRRRPASELKKHFNDKEGGGALPASESALGLPELAHLAGERRQPVGAGLEFAQGHQAADLAEGQQGRRGRATWSACAAMAGWGRQRSQSGGSAVTWDGSAVSALPVTKRALRALSCPIF